MNKNQRMDVFIKSLATTSPVNNPNDAHALLKKTMDDVEDTYSGVDKSNFSLRMHVFPMTAGCGWQNLDKNPRFWIDSVKGTHKTEIYNNGRIVITHIASGKTVIDKPGI